MNLSRLNRYFLLSIVLTFKSSELLSQTPPPTPPAKKEASQAPQKPAQEPAKPLPAKKTSPAPQVKIPSFLKQLGVIKAFTQDGKVGAYQPPLGSEGPQLVTLATGKTMLSLKAEKQEVKGTPPPFTPSVMEFNAQGTQFAATVVDHTILSIWDTKTGKEIAQCKGHTKAITTVAFNPQGKTVATGSADHTARIWDIQTGKELKKLEGHTETINTLIYTHDGKKIMTGSDDRTVRTWHSETGKLLQMITAFNWPIYKIAVNRQGNLLAVIALSPAPGVQLFTLPSGEKLETLKDHTKFIRAVAFSPDGTRLATGSDDTTIKVWSVETKKADLTLKGHTAPVIEVAFNPTGTTLYSSADDYTFRTWDIKLPLKKEVPSKTSQKKEKV